jgi:hypothetical protein
MPPYHFIGTRPTAVMFGNERVEVKTWKQVAGVILKRCHDERGDALMNLRNKVSGRVRMIFADKPDGMRNPLKITEDAYLESHYGSQTLMYIVKDLILDNTGFDYSNITIAVKRK